MKNIITINATVSSIGAAKELLDILEVLKKDYFLNSSVTIDDNHLITFSEYKENLKD